MISEIIQLINNAFAGIHQDEKFFGLAQTIEYKSGEAIIKLPAIIDFTGEAKYVGIDDVNSIMGYHILNNANITQLTNGNGDHMGDVRNIFSMSLYIYWDTTRLKLYADQIMMLLQSRLPIAINGLKDVKQAIIRQIGVNTDSLQNYNSEYETDNTLPQTKQILRLNYNIEITFNSTCFRQCPDCN